MRFPLVAVFAVAVGCSSSSGSGPAASACPESNLDMCPEAPGATACGVSGCGLDALPTGMACQGASQCSIPIQPVPGCGRVDGYVCSCAGGHWSCDDCAPGGAVCEGGTTD